MKSIEEIIEFTNQNPAAWVATAVENQPHVRAMAMWYADKSGFYFHTGSQKRLYTQLKNNPRIEAGFMQPGEMGNMQMVRITGIIEQVVDPVLEKKLFEDRPWLNEIFRAYPDDKIFIFRLAHGEAQYWDMSRNCQEKDIPPILF
ncbi:MAG: pyridoxamine 5'-phosphate oxidase family protein [Fibrobacter sp.]|nr:pyridoxamine 5'-phosphate oxidase family protein [Fibrobacter sp.]